MTNQLSPQDFTELKRLLDLLNGVEAPLAEIGGAYDLDVIQKQETDAA